MVTHRDPSAARTPFVTLERNEWAALRAGIALPLSESDLPALRGLDEVVLLDEVADIYLPLARLLNLEIRAVQELHAARQSFLRKPADRTPFVIGLAGSVAVGKSTTARTLRALLSHWSDHPEVVLVSTDGFLYPNPELEARGWMNRRASPRATTCAG